MSLAVRVVGGCAYCLALVALVAAGPVGAASAKASARPTKAAKAKHVEAPRERPSYASRDDVNAFVDELVANEGFSRDVLLALFADARYSETAARLMRPSPTAVRRDWTVYRARVVEPIRIAAGVRFWTDNADTLARAEQAYGVPPEIVVGILGVETIYGRDTGTFRVLDALTTLAFDWPNPARDRSGFFRSELAEALRWSRETGSDLRERRGSFAGAIGMPQFMPGSIRRFAVDFDGDGRIDLAGDEADVIGSVANFLAMHGWVRGVATHVPLVRAGSADAAFDVSRAARIDALVAAGSIPSLDLVMLRDAGLIADGPEPAGVSLALIDLPSGGGTRYLAGTQNFHAITRYNRSYFYALSVIELGAAVRGAIEGR